MWCIGKLTEEYRRRMYGLLELYAKPYSEEEPVVCVDEKSKQLLQQARIMSIGVPAHAIFLWLLNPRLDVAKWK